MDTIKKSNIEIPDFKNPKSDYSNTNNMVNIRNNDISNNVMIFEAKGQKNTAPNQKKRIGKVKEDFNSDIDLEPYKKIMNNIVNNSKSKRKTITNLAMFLATTFPKLPYVLDYSSGHDGADLRGLDWTLELVQREDGSYGYRTLDCSGLVSWCFQNAGLDVPGYGNTNSYKGIIEEGNRSPIVGCDLNKFKPGDFAFTEAGGGHIGIITDVDKDAHEITVVHTSYSGGGVNITKIDTQTGMITYDDTGSTGVDRTGQYNYFTDIMHVNYDDDNVKPKEKAVA